MHIFLVLLAALCVSSCVAPQLQTASDISRNPELNPASAVMGDGYALPYAVWSPQGSPQAIVLAIHGFNDYSNAFSGSGALFANKGIKTYAYDQRGFGNTAQRGVWPGVETLVSDARVVARLLCEQYPNIPFYVLGESMGGAVAMQFMDDVACINGVILVAPAVWGWQTMPVWQRSALWLVAHTVPGFKVSGKGLDITPSDNTPMLRALGRDPLVIKETRFDTIYGLTNLMEQAFLIAPQLNQSTLLLYGEKDEIIPPNPVCKMLGDLPQLETEQWQMALYPGGYHMLTRDLQANIVLEDMIAWMKDQNAPLPSGAETTQGARNVQAMCK